MDVRNPDTWSAELTSRVAKTRALVAELHAELPKWGLIVWTAGNVSQRIRGEAEDGSQDLLVIKPVSYTHLTLPTILLV